MFMFEERGMRWRTAALVCCLSSCALLSSSLGRLIWCICFALAAYWGIVRDGREGACSSALIRLKVSWGLRLNYCSVPAFCPLCPPLPCLLLRTPPPPHTKKKMLKNAFENKTQVLRSLVKVGRIACDKQGLVPDKGLAGEKNGGVELEGRGVVGWGGRQTGVRVRRTQSCHAAEPLSPTWARYGDGVHGLKNQTFKPRLPFLRLATTFIALISYFCLFRSNKLTVLITQSKMAPRSKTPVCCFSV